MTEQNSSPEAAAANSKMSEEERKLNLALYYTQGDKEKALKMIDGEYQDLNVFKIKFSSPSLFGACIMFFNNFFCRLADCYGILSPSYAVKDIDNTAYWTEYEQQISGIFSLDEHDNNLVLQLLDRLKDSINSKIGQELSEAVAANNSDTIETILRDLIMSKMGLQSVQLSVVYDTISSLDMEYNSVSSMKISDQMMAMKDYTRVSDDNDDFSIELEDEDNEMLKAKKIKMVFNGEVILSPIKGMHISGLVIDDRINVKIRDANPSSIRIAKAFNAYQEGEMKPIAGRVISFRRKAERGFKIFVEIAEGVVVRIDEDEEDIKVDFISASPDRPPELQKDIEKYVDKHVDQKKKLARAERKKAEQEKKTAKKDQATSKTALVIVSVVLIIALIIIVVMYTRI